MGKGEHEDHHAGHRTDDAIHTVIAKEKTKVDCTNKVSPDQTTTEESDHAHALRKQEERREREPLLYCKLVTKWPLRSFLITLAGHLLMVFISIILVASGYNLLPVDFENLPLEITDQPWLPRDLAWTYKDTFDGYYDRTPTAGYRTDNFQRANLDLYYDAKGGNIFTKERLNKIQEIEDQLTAVPSYQSTYCQLNSAGTACVKPLSIIRYFDGKYASIDPVFNDTNFDNIAGVIYAANTNNATKGLFQFFLGRSNQITPSYVYSSITRSIIQMGFPLQGYTDVDEYEAKMKTWSVSDLKPILVRTRENVDQFDFSYRSDMLWLQDVLDQAMKDVLCAVGSICFIFILILVHTRSLWITGFAILSILTSFVCTNLIYRVVLDFRYIGFFHVLTLFIVLGIGADDIFVFYDVWRNTAHEKYPSLAHRLSDAYRKSVFSMFFTSLTTSVAFFASAISPLLATRSFGVFSGIVIIVNYLSVILYFPTVVIMYHTRFEKFKWPCITFCKSRLKSRCGKKQDSDNVEKDVENLNAHDKSEKGDAMKHEPLSPVKVTMVNSNPSVIRSPSRAKSATHIGNGTTMLGHTNQAFQASDGNEKPALPTSQETSTPIATSPKKRKQKSPVVLFFRDKYSKFVTHKIFRWVILGVMAAVLIFFIIQASRLEPDNEGFKVLKDSHVYSIAAAHSTNSFVSSDNDRTLIIYIVWGMHQNDLSSCHFSTPECLGTRVWDKNFNPSTPAAQQGMLDFCNTILNLPNSKVNELRIRRDFTTGDLQVNCYMNNLDAFLQSESASTGKDWDLTYNYTKAVSFMDERTTYYDSSTFNNGYEDYLEIPISYWLSNKYTFNYETDFYLFGDLIGEEVGSYSQPLKTDNTRKYGNNIKYVAVQVNTTIRYQTLGYAEGIPIMDKWEEFVNQQNALMPVEMDNAFQTTRYYWHWLRVSKMLAENAIYGVIMGVSLAFPILVIATGNIITGFLATFSMCCSTVCVIGVIPLGGWKLGVLVSLNMCMVVGLTVDYVVHLAEGYTLSLHHDRFSRVRDMLDEMAVSVFFGACTTLGASMFMFLAQLSFFLQFGIFMFSTIGFSLFFSMGMFVTLMGLIGPQGDNGKVIAIYRKIRSKCKREPSKKDNENGSEVNIVEDLT